MNTIIDRSVDVSGFTEAGGLLFGPGISEGSMGLVQKTAGGIWKLEAKKNIADYFLKNMGDLIDAGKVVVMQ